MMDFKLDDGRISPEWCVGICIIAGAVWRLIFAVVWFFWPWYPVLLIPVTFLAFTMVGWLALCLTGTLIEPQPEEGRTR